MRTEARARRRRMHAFGIGVAAVLSIVGASISLLPVAAGATCNPAPHAPILLRSDSDFTAANGVVSGAGTVSHPYLIANLQFKDLSVGYGLKVDNSKGTVTKYFSVTCIQSSFTYSAPTGSVLIWIVKVHRATTISLVSANSGEAGGSVAIRVDASSAITLDNENINKFGADGIQLNGSDHITVIESKLKAFGNGLTIQGSYAITVGQTCNINSAKNCNEFTYDDGRGIFIENSHDITVVNTITSADDTGGILIDGKYSYGIALTGGMATADGPICPSGTPTGLMVDTIAGIAVTNGAHDITVRGYTMQANGDGAGGYFDLMNGGNGMYLNPCTGIITTFASATPPGGANLDFNGNCYHFEYNFNPAPTVSCTAS